MAAPDNSPRAVDCPAPPLGCAANAGEPCFSHGGTVERHDFHQGRTAAWNAKRIAQVPSAKLVADAVADRTVRSAKQAARLLDGRGYTTEVALIQKAVVDRRGLMSAKQAVDLLVQVAEGGAG
ncbi:hypothetical protein [Streptomyces sp. NPDC094468]|uniref:zinc finger domain-containing protein n=1 Tax=Streptomyces sp. NPDC094468 TaxID=3366066 RepID=UPI0038058771